MLKLILTLPQDMDAELLMTTALALANYKVHKACQFKLERTTRADYVDYEGVDLISYEPDSVWNNAGHEYEVSGDILDPFLMETLCDLQRLIPFEMHFENRGKYDPAEWLYQGYEIGEIYDDALNSLFYCER